LVTLPTRLIFIQNMRLGCWQPWQEHYYITDCKSDAHCFLSVPFSPKFLKVIAPNFSFHTYCPFRMFGRRQATHSNFSFILVSSINSLMDPSLYTFSTLNHQDHKCFCCIKIKFNIYLLAYVNKFFLMN